MPTLRATRDSLSVKSLFNPRMVWCVIVTRLQVMIRLIADYTRRLRLLINESKTRDYIIPEQHEDNEICFKVLTIQQKRELHETIQNGRNHFASLVKICNL